jgi:hypothetical protein
MLQYIKILLSFILSIVMDKNDFNFGHKDFKPMRVVFWTLLAINVPVTIFLLDVIHDSMVKMEKMCPGVLTPVDVVKKEKK